MGNSNSNKNCPKDIICEASGCSAQAAFRILVKVGTNRAIRLFVCRNCKPKFCGNGDDILEVKG